MKIAISGHSGSGKTTLAKMLANKHKMRLLSQDDYWNHPMSFYMRTPDQDPADQYRIFEFPQEYDGIKIAENMIRSGDCIVEGFSIMAYPEIRNLVDWHFYVNTPWDICVDRREKRDSNKNGRSTFSWKKLGERGNELIVSFQRDLQNTSIINGTNSIEKMCLQASQIMEKINKNKLKDLNYPTNNF